MLSHKFKTLMKHPQIKGAYQQAVLENAIHALGHALSTKKNSKDPSPQQEMFTWNEMRKPADSEAFRRRKVALVSRTLEHSTCPRCNAGPGQMCVTVKGRYPGRELYAFHVGRIKEVRKLSYMPRKASRAKPMKWPVGPTMRQLPLSFEKKTTVAEVRVPKTNMASFFLTVQRLQRA